MIHVGVIAKCLKLILHCFEVEYAGKAVENSGTTLAICCKAHFLEVGRAGFVICNLCCCQMVCQD